MKKEHKVIISTDDYQNYLDQDSYIEKLKQELNDEKASRKVIHEINIKFNNCQYTYLNSDFSWESDCKKIIQLQESCNIINKKLNKLPKFIKWIFKI